MESLLRAVLTSPDNFGTHANPPVSKRDIKMANPHLHAALTSNQLKPRPAMKLTKSVVEQPPNDTAGDKRPCQFYQKAPRRHSKLLEAIISGVNQPSDNNLQSPKNPNTNGLKNDKNPKKTEALHKSRLFMALTSPMVSLDNWLQQDNHNTINKSDHRPAKCKANGIGPQELQVRSRSKTAQNMSDQNNRTSVTIKTEQASDGEDFTTKSYDSLDKSRTTFNSFNDSISADSATLVSNCNIYKKTHTANPAKVLIKYEPQSEIVENANPSWEDIRDQNKMVSINEPECNMDIDEGFNGGVTSDDSRGSDQNDANNSLSECFRIKKECQEGYDGGDEMSFVEYSLVPDQQMKEEPGNSCSSTSDEFPSAPAISANIAKKSPEVSASNHSRETEPSNLCSILKSAHKRKNSDPIHISPPNNLDERIASVPHKRKKMLIERNSVNKKNPTPIDTFETEPNDPVPNREAGIFQKKSNTDAQILRRVLTEGIGELRGSTNSQQSVPIPPKSLTPSQIKDRQQTSANTNTNQSEKSPIKSQILRAALTSAEPIVPIRKTKPESQSPSCQKVPPSAIKTETSSSGLNTIPPSCSNPPDNTDRSGASAVKKIDERVSSIFSNSDGQDTMKTAAAEDKPQKTKCQLLLAALTASDNSKKSNLSNESAPKQTSSEILRAALNNAEKDSLGMGAKHSQLLRAALTAVDTNKAAKSWHQTNTKLTNSRLLRAVLTGKYIPDNVDSTDYSKAAHRKGPSSCNTSESKNDFSVSNTKLGTITRSYDIVEITPNLGASTAGKNDKVQKVSSSVNGSSTRSGGNSILRAVLTGAIDISHRAHESTKNNSVKHPELIANSNENHKSSDVVSSCQGTVQDKKVKNNNNNHTQPISSSSSSSSSSSLSPASESGCKEQCCEYCGKYHSRGDSLWEYTSQFAGDTPHCCYMCKQSFGFTCLFLDHMDTHTDISSKYKCEFCGRHFKHVLSYIMCRLSHIDAQKEERISCNLCDCEFTCHNKLKQHTRIHAEDRFTCKFCGKQFHQRVNCYLHERDHVDNKMSYTCKMCGEKLELASDLKAHHKTHYAAELFKCSICIKCFVTPKALKLHEKTHIPVDHQEDECNKKVFDDHQVGNPRDKRKFLCEGCGLIWNSRYSLAKHKATCGAIPFMDKKYQVDMVSHSLVAIKD